MKKEIILTAFTAALAIGATTASAATLDFHAESFGNERAITSGDTLNTSNTGNIDVILSATYNGQTANPYLDSGGALGVCHSGLSGAQQCSNASDDNVTNGETVTIGFNTAMDLSNLWFIAEGHGSGFSAFSLLTGTNTLLVTTSSMAETQYTFAALIAETFYSVTYLTLGYGGTAAEQFYLGGAVANAPSPPPPSAVPVPAGGLLLLSALGGLGFARRRKNRAA